MTLTSGAPPSNQARTIEMRIWPPTDPTHIPPLRLQNQPLISDKSIERVDYEE